MVDDYSEFDTVTWHYQPPLTPPFQGGGLITIFFIHHCTSAQQLLRGKRQEAREYSIGFLIGRVYQHFSCFLLLASCFFKKASCLLLLASLKLYSSSFTFRLRRSQRVSLMLSLVVRNHSPVSRLPRFMPSPVLLEE